MVRPDFSYWFLTRLYWTTRKILCIYSWDYEETRELKTGKRRIDFFLLEILDGIRKSSFSYRIILFDYVKFLPSRFWITAFPMRKNNLAS